MDVKSAALKKRIAPSVPLTLELMDDSGSKLVRTFRLSFDFNAITTVEERTGYSLLTGEIWKHLNAKTLSVMLWAALLANHEEYDSEDGLTVIRSFMDAGNADLITEKLLDAYIASLPPDKQKLMNDMKQKALGGAPDPTQESATAT